MIKCYEILQNAIQLSFAFEFYFEERGWGAQNNQATKVQNNKVQKGINREILNSCNFIAIYSNLQQFIAIVRNFN